MPSEVQAHAAPARKTRVMFILNSLCVGGAEKHVVSLINRLDQSLFSVSLTYLKREEQLLDQLDASRCTDGLHCLDVTKGLDLRAVGAIAKYIDEKQADIVVCTNMFALLYGWLARVRSSRRPKMVEVYHTTDLGSRKEWVSMFLYRPLVRLSDLIVYVCHGQAAQWRRNGMRARQDMVIYNGIDTRRFMDVWSGDEKRAVRESYGLAPSDYVVGLCAVLRPEKAHGDLITAAAMLRQRGIELKCLLIGDGPERARIEQQAAESGLAEHVVITGFLQDVRPVIAACDVMVLASRSVETFSISALEAMALGKPMVMTRIGGAPEQVTPGENGLLFEPGDTVALADALEQLADPDARRRMGQQAVDRVTTRFDVGTMVKGFDTALTDLMNGAPLRSSPAA